MEYVKTKFYVLSVGPKHPAAASHSLERVARPAKHNSVVHAAINNTGIHQIAIDDSR